MTANPVLSGPAALPRWWQPGLIATSRERVGQRAEGDLPEDTQRSLHQPRWLSCLSLRTIAVASMFELGLRPKFWQAAA
jgi:hypothetical protein